MKKYFKLFLGRFYCMFYRVKCCPNIYIGIGSKLIGGGKDSSLSQRENYASSNVGFLAWWYN